jgi:DNA-binding transcriptional MerR regulator
MQGESMADLEFGIGHLSRETGCKIPTIRYYEQIGLLPEPRRSAGNTRVYNQAHHDRLVFIRHCRDLGFGQPAVRELLNLTEQPDLPCAAVTEIANMHLKTINLRIAKLTVLKSELEQMIAACEGGRISECRIVGALADHPQ